MPVQQLTLIDERVGDQSIQSFIAVDRPRLAVRELLRRHIRQQAAEFNARIALFPDDLHDPPASPDGGDSLFRRHSTNGTADWESEFQTLSNSFEAGRFQLLINGEPVISLDCEIRLPQQSVVRFTLR